MQQFKRGLACVALALLVTTSAWSDEDTTQAEQLRILNEGYSLLYSGASGASNANKVFLVKLENDATEKVIDDASTYLAKFAGQLEQLAKDYPSLRLDLQPLPKIEVEKQSAANIARIKSFAPVTGRTGADFERTLLFTLSGGLNQFRHLARVMAEEERSEQRREFLRTAEARMDELYNAMLKLLSERYYVHDTYEGAE